MRKFIKLTLWKPNEHIEFEHALMQQYNPMGSTKIASTCSFYYDITRA